MSATGLELTTGKTNYWSGAGRDLEGSNVGPDADAKFGAWQVPHLRDLPLSTIDKRELR